VYSQNLTLIMNENAWASQTYLGN